MTLVALPSRQGEGKVAMLEVLDLMRAKIERGELVAFAAVGVEPGDETTMWSGACTGVTRLRVLGGIANLQHWFAAGE